MQQLCDSRQRLHQPWCRPPPAVPPPPPHTGPPAPLQPHIRKAQQPHQALPRQSAFMSTPVPTTRGAHRGHPRRPRPMLTRPTLTRHRPRRTRALQPRPCAQRESVRPRRRGCRHQAAETAVYTCMCAAHKCSKRLHTRRAAPDVGWSIHCTHAWWHTARSLRLQAPGHAPSSTTRSSLALLGCLSHSLAAEQHHRAPGQPPWVSHGAGRHVGRPAWVPPYHAMTALPPHAYEHACAAKVTRGLHHRVCGDVQGSAARERSVPAPPTPPPHAPAPAGTCSSLRSRTAAPAARHGHPVWASHSAAAGNAPAQTGHHPVWCGIQQATLYVNLFPLLISLHAASACGVLTPCMRWHGIGHVHTCMGREVSSD